MDADIKVGSPEHLSLIEEYRDPVTKRMLPGHPGLPNAGTQHRKSLSDAFIQALVIQFAEDGQAAIKFAFRRDPLEALRLVARLVPKEVHMTEDAASTYTDALRAISARIIEGEVVSSEVTKPKTKRKTTKKKRTNGSGNGAASDMPPR